MELADYDFKDQVDFDKIIDAATLTADALRTAGVTVHAAIVPNDGTIYRILIVSPHGAVATGPHQDVRVYDDRYIVAMVGPEGSTMVWSGNEVHPGYVESHLGAGYHTSRVVAGFLNEIAARLETR